MTKTLTTPREIDRAIHNLRLEEPGDWYRDPWGWPEYDYLRREGHDALQARVRSNTSPRPVSELDVPKENFGLRPAMVLDLLDRVTYQIMVDRVSVDAIGNMSRKSLGWRLPYKVKGPGEYARQDFQWASYRRELSFLSGQFEYGLKTDVSSCFASIPVDAVVNLLVNRTNQNRAIDKIARMLHGWESSTSRTGLPQRSTASAVLANMYLSQADPILEQYSSPVIGRRWPGPERQRAHCRWMDDMWMFSNDESALRRGQVDLESTLLAARLHLNAGKTSLLTGNELIEAARKIQHSAVADALFENQSRPLEELIDEILNKGELADKTTVKFAVTRMRQHNVSYRVDDLIDIAHKIPHAADSLSRMIRRFKKSSEIQDWLVDYVDGPWNAFEWTLAQFGTAVPSRRRPRRRVVDLFADLLEHGATELPLVALASQRMATWVPDEAIDLIRSRVESETSPHLTRVLSLAALRAGEQPSRVRRWLTELEATQITLLTLESLGFASPRITRDYY